MLIEKINIFQFFSGRGERWKGKRKKEKKKKREKVLDFLAHLGIGVSLHVVGPHRLGVSSLYVTLGNHLRHTTCVEQDAARKAERAVEGRVVCFVHRHGDDYTFRVLYRGNLCPVNTVS